MLRKTWKRLVPKGLHKWLGDNFERYQKWSCKDGLHALEPTKIKPSLIGGMKAEEAECMWCDEEFEGEWYRCGL